MIIQNNTDRSVRPVRAPLPLSGVMNFREMGGLKGQYGRRIKRGSFWRSAGLDRPCADDIALITSLNLRTVVDLRGERERSAFPTHVELTQSCNTLWSTSGTDGKQVTTLSKLNDSYDENILVEAISSLYKQIAHQHTDHIRMAFDAIAASHVPILIHCAAGKDRTGVIVSLILDTLGVDRTDIMESYLETNEHLDWDRLSISATAGTGIRETSLDLMTPPALAILKQAKPEFLNAALADIDNRYGSVETFLMQEAGVSQSIINQVCDTLLE